ncbi:biotin synthase [Candidatus Riesia sp. GBBU]|nr:biotin synthase [Candidatus Riesia sp. GBBU]ARC55059.1 biotin synthase [Candidatus Riesia sp. GBBU]
MKKKWTINRVKSLYNLPFFNLLFRAQKIHRKSFNPQEIQISSLLSIKTGSCPEDCKYCPQSSHYSTKVKKEGMLPLSKIISHAKEAKKNGSTRFCMGAAWGKVQDKDISYLENIIKEVKSLGMETCMTLGKLSKDQANKLSKAGLDYYNHNLDTSYDFYKKIITTRSYQDRIDTINLARKSGMKICSGGIIGLGEKVDDRIKLLVQLSSFEKSPESVPINMLVRIKGTPLFDNKSVDSFDFIRTIAVARIVLPKSFIRLSAGREKMNEHMQTLCFISGANSIFYGCKLLTAKNVDPKKDENLFKKLNVQIKKIEYKNTKNNISKENSKNFYDAMKI